MNRLLFIAPCAILWGVQPAMAQRAQVAPYIEATQVLTADLGSDEVLTYSTVAVGADATIQTRRVEVQVSYKYERFIDYEGRLDNNETHSGLASAQVRLTPSLSVEGGAIAARSRADFRGDAAVTGQGNVRNVSQVYSAYAGPNLATRVGPAFVNAAYRIGYSKVEAPSGGTGVSPDAPPLDLYDDSTVHVATASAGVKAGDVAPVGVTVSGSYTREDAGQLDQRFEGKYVRGDVVLPVGPEIALVAGAGYENIQISERDALRDSTGRPVRDGAGRFRTDPSSPRRIAYDLDGMYWDAGVMWRPSSRTFLEARVGRRYDTMSYTGSFSYQLSAESGVQIGVYDSVQTFGQQLNGRLTMLPDTFATSNDPFGNQYGGCVYGKTGAAAGGCLNDVFASAATSAFRARGITGVAVMNRGGTSLGFGGGYARRSFIAPRSTVAGRPRVDGTSDETYYAQFFASNPVGVSGSLSTSVMASYYDTDLAGADGVFGWGANTAYTHSFGRLGATASLGAFGYGRGGDTDATLQALLGLRYGF